MDWRSRGYSSNISDLRPEMRPLAEEWLRQIATAGLNARITQTLRTEAYQKSLFGSGASHNILGWHCFGLAFDWACYDAAGNYIENGQDSAYLRCGEIGESLGLRWGGRWIHHPDWDHLEFAGDGTLAQFIAAQNAGIVSP